MQDTWLVLLPPILVIACAYITRHIILSLLIGIFSALFIANDFSITKIIPSFFSKLWETTEISTMTSWDAVLSSSALFICCFLLMLSILTILLHESGGIYAYGTCIKRYLKKPWHAEAASLVLSSFLFVDDYFSSLTVGSVMQSVTDFFHIPRVKLALLTNSMAASLCVLAPVSSWVAEIITNMQRGGLKTQGASVLINGDPFSVYLGMIPFFFYSIMLVFTLWYLTCSRRSYGIVRQHEVIAQKTGNLFGGKNGPVLNIQENREQSALIDFALPMCMLFTTVFLSMLYFGDFYGLGGIKSFVLALQQSPKQASLFIGSLVTLIFSTLFLVIRKKISCAKLAQIYLRGVSLMGPSIIFLILILTLGILLRSDLATGKYIAHALGKNFHISLLPVFFFLVAVVIGTLMGSAWGAMGILIPIAIDMALSLLSLHPPVALEHIMVIYPLLGAVVSGAVAANHLSPIADTSLMSTKSAGSYHHDLVQAQLQLSIPVVVAAAIAYLCAGIMIAWTSMLLTIICSLSIGIIAGLVIVTLLAKKQ